MLSLVAPLASFVGMETGELAKRVKRNAVLWGAITLFGVIALIFLLVALHAAMVAWLGPIWGPVAIAGAALVLALGIYGVAHLTKAIAHRRGAQRRHAAERTALVTTAAVTALPVLMKTPLMKTIGLPLGGALAAVFLLSKSGVGGSNNAR